MGKMAGRNTDRSYLWTIEMSCRGLFWRLDSNAPRRVVLEFTDRLALSLSTENVMIEPPSHAL